LDAETRASSPETRVQPLPVGDEHEGLKEYLRFLKRKKERKKKVVYAHQLCLVGCKSISKNIL